MDMLLDNIRQENDIKNLNEEDLALLAEEIREFLIEKISATGGHLGSNLGAVELTMALHLALNLPEDKIIYILQIMQGVNGLYNDNQSERKEAFARLEKLCRRGNVTNYDEELASYRKRDMDDRILVDYQTGAPSRGTQVMQFSSKITQGKASGSTAWLITPVIEVNERHMIANFSYSMIESANRFTSNPLNDWADDDCLELLVSTDGGQDVGITHKI